MTPLTLNTSAGLVGTPLGSSHRTVPRPPAAPASSSQSLFSAPSASLVSSGPNGTLFAEDHSEEYLPSDDDYYEDEWEYGDYDPLGRLVSEHDEYHFDGVPRARDLEPGLKKSWESAFGIKPSKFFRELFDTKKVGLRGGVVVMERDEEGKVESAEVHCRLARPGTRMLIGALDYSFSFADDGSPLAHLSLFELGYGAQGQGIAKEVMANSVSLFRTMGINEISLTAGKDVGGYAWPKLGFTPEKGQTTRRLFKEIRERLSDLDLPGSVKQTVRKLLRGNDPRAVWTISDLSGVSLMYQGEQVTLGQALLLSTEWHGFLDLKDQVAMARFDQYVTLPRAVATGVAQ